MIAEVLPTNSDMPPEAQELQQEGSILEAWAYSLLIVDEASHAEACAQERRLAEAEKLAKAKTDPAVEAAKKSLAEAKGVQDWLVTPFARARALVRKKIGAYRAEQERLANEQAAERRRLAAARAQEDAVDKAVRLEDAGRLAEAEAALDRAPMVPLVVAAPVATHGVGMRRNWTATVHDFKALILWVAERPDDRAKYLQPCSVLLNSEARALKDGMNIPGVKAEGRKV